MRDFILKFYNERIEDFCVRLLYLMNTIDSFFLISGILTFLVLNGASGNIFVFLTLIALTSLCFKIADFHPFFVLLSPLYFLLLWSLGTLNFLIVLQVIGVNTLIFAIIQFLFMGIPDSIVARDFSIPLRKFWNSIWTVAATTVSLSMSVYFASLLSFILLAKPYVNNFNGFLFWVVMFSSAFLTRKFRPKTFISNDFKPPLEPIKAVERVIILNIDGVRLDRFYEAKLPFLTALEKESSYFPKGIMTVYRALTNPAFASILTGTTPSTHGVKDNNIKRYIKTEALPDLVNTVLYGSMHVKHFSKNQWNTKVVSLPVHSVYKSDEIMLNWLRDDLIKEKDARLFIADISEADFLGHAYGSESVQYLDALKRADKRIEDFFGFLRNKGLDKDAVVIICSDHGIKNIDHSYLLFDAEKYVPCLITGKNIKKDNPLNFQASIMDIALTVSYFLGIRYPKDSRGRVFIEATI